MSRRGGVVTGFVEGVDAAQGRVRVEYRGIEDGMLSSWAYVAAPLAGPRRGALFMPEVGDEVLVCYADADFDHPFVVGFLWNGEQRSPERDPQMRVIRTPGDNELRFEDKDAAKKVVLRSAGGRRLTLDDKPGMGRVQVLSGSNEVLLDDTPAATRVQLRAGQGVGVTITMTATPQPSLAISVGAGATIHIDATGMSLTSTAALTVNAGGAANVTVGGTANLTVGGAATISCSVATLNAAAAATINTPVLSVNSGIATFAGVVQASAVVTQSVVSPVYTPGAGNLL